MMRLARAIAPLYSQLNIDLLIAGILFHDSGKLWENQFSETGFVMSYDELGELVGHISIGLEIVNSLWQKLAAENADLWKTYRPLSEDVRIHLLHLIGSHHGDKQLGSPVDPKTPEAMALHYIDNLDARLEMFAAGYTTAKPLAARIFDRVRPLPGLTLSGWYFNPLAGGGDFEPPYHGRLSVTFYSKFWRHFRSGAFALRAEYAFESWSGGLGGVHRDSLGNASQLPLPGATFSEFNVQLQIVGVTAFWLQRNSRFFHGGYVHGLDYPRRAQFFGVRWIFTN